MTQVLNWRNGKGPSDVFGKCWKQTTKEALNEFSFFVVHETPLRKKNAVCSFSLQNNTLVCSPSSCRCTQSLTDGLEGQCNWVLESLLSWGMAPCLPLWYLWHRKSILLQNRWHLRWDKLHIQQIFLISAVGSLLTSVKLEAYYTKEIHNLFLGLSVFILALIKASRKPQHKISYFRKRHTGKCSRYVTGKLAACVSKHNL